MTYFSFLLLFLVLPIGLLLIFAVRDSQRGKIAFGFLEGWPVGSRLVCTCCWRSFTQPLGTTTWLPRVRWYYNPSLISGVVLGWVPLEEYSFFVLETFLVGLWWLLLVRRVKTSGEFRPRRKISIVITVVLAAVWLLTIGVLISGWKPATYLALIWFGRCLPSCCSSHLAWTSCGIFERLSYSRYCRYFFMFRQPTRLPFHQVHGPLIQPNR